MTDAQLFEAFLWWLGFCSACCFAFIAVVLYDDRKYGVVYDPDDTRVDLWEQATTRVPR